MREVERVAIELGLTHILMMKNAGANLAAASTMLGGTVSGRRTRSSRDRAVLEQMDAPIQSAPADSVVFSRVIDAILVTDPTVRAAATLAEALPKEALRAGPARPLVGELYLADIRRDQLHEGSRGIIWSGDHWSPPPLQYPRARRARALSLRDPGRRRLAGFTEYRRRPGLIAFTTR